MSRGSVDLHVHSNYSDGTWPPTRVMAEAANAGLRTVALTDHDTVEGVAEAMQAASARGLTCWPGIELSAQDDSHDYHLLGLLIDAGDVALRRRLALLVNARRERLVEMLRRLTALGAPISIEEVLVEGGHGTVGRPHVARVLQQRGYVASVDEAFDRWLGFGKPAYVSAHRLSPAEGIALIRSGGGIPILAHPVYLRDDTVIPGLVEAGLAGIEAYHPGHASADVRRYLALAQQHGLLVSGGSDCHGMLRGAPQIGSVAVPEAIVEQLHTWHAQQTRH